MKECLYCKREYKPKTERAKFCSTSCRVMNNRKNGGNSIKPFQMKALYNDMKEVLAQIKNGVPITDKPVFQYPLDVKDAFKPKEKLKITRTAEQWQELKRECLTVDEWENLKEQIENAENLSTKQKQIIINTP